MTKSEKQEAMLKWLKSQKHDAEYQACVTAEHHGEVKYIKEQNEKAAMIEEIIQIVENKHDTGFSYILHTKGFPFPNRIAFKSSEEAEVFADKNGLKGCSLECIQYAKKDGYDLHRRKD